MTEYRDDPDLTPEEKEITITFGAHTDRLHIHAEKATVVKWLDNHPRFNERNRREKNGVLHALTGTLPLGALKLSGDRKSTTMSSVLGGYPSEDTDD